MSDQLCVLDVGAHHREATRARSRRAVPYLASSTISFSRALLHASTTPCVDADASKEQTSGASQQVDLNGQKSCKLRHKPPLTKAKGRTHFVCTISFCLGKQFCQSFLDKHLAQILCSGSATCEVTFSATNNAARLPYPHSLEPAEQVAGGAYDARTAAEQFRRSAPEQWRWLCALQRHR